MEQIEKIQGTEKEFIKVFQELCYSRSSWQVWADLMAAMACTLANSVDTPWLIDNYFRSYRKYPFIEQLLKVGFYRMTREFLEDNRVNAIVFNTSQRTVLGTLGIGKIQYNMLRKLEDPAIRDLEILRYKPDLKWEEFNDLRYISDNGHIDMYKKYIDLMAYTTLHKIIRYISEQKLTTRDNGV